MEVRPDPTRGVGFRQERRIIGSAGGASDGRSAPAPAAESVMVFEQFLRYRSRRRASSRIAEGLWSLNK